MCFIKSPSAPALIEAPKQSEVVQRHQANASATKAQKSENTQGFRENLKTSPVGIEEETTTQKKTFLGE